MVSEKDRNTFLARLCEQAERYDEMVEYMKLVAAEGRELTVDERNLLSVAYKNVIGTRRASWRLIVSIEQKEESRGSSSHLKFIEAYKHKIENELEGVCQDVLSLIDDKLLPASVEGEPQVFYYKLKGDYYRYLAEFLEGDKKKDAAAAAHDAYKQATEIAQRVLSPTHPIRLGLALNFSVFYYEILNSASRACHLAKQAFDDAILDLDSLPEELLRDSTTIMALLRDNLSYWANTEVENETEAPAGTSAGADASAGAGASAGASAGEAKPIEAKPADKTDKVDAKVAAADPTQLAEAAEAKVKEEVKQ